jgi:RNA polymerase sigma-70 factor, ECF subfamily
MTDPAHRHAKDPVLRRVREAFAHLEPRIDLDGVVKRATRHLHRNRAVTVGGTVLVSADLAAAKRRDPAAMEHLYQAYAPALLRYFVAGVGDRQAAEDLTGTTLAAAVEALPGYRAEVDQLGGWLFRIARHDLHDHWRRAARSSPARPDTGAETAPAEGRPASAEAVLEPSRVIAAMEQLSPDQREVLLLRLAAGLTVREVASVLAKTTGAVKALQHRGLASLARRLERPGDHPGRADPDMPSP